MSSFRILNCGAVSLGHGRRNAEQQGEHADNGNKFLHNFFLITKPSRVREGCFQKIMALAADASGYGETGVLRRPLFADYSLAGSGSTGSMLPASSGKSFL